MENTILENLDNNELIGMNEELDNVEVEDE